MISKVKGVSFLDLSVANRALGEDRISVVERADLPIEIKRVFFITGSEGSKRGRHSHRLCNQILICVHGEISLLVSDGDITESFEINADSPAIHLSPGVWAEQVYKRGQSILAVLCDRVWEDADYIRDYNEFLLWKDSL